MTIEQLGSIGELVAAIATVVTLAYLARQIRSSAIATNAEARRAVRSDSAQTFHLIAGDSDVARVFLAGLAGPGTLAPQDAIRFTFLLAEFVSHIEATFKEWRSGAGTEAEVRDVIQKNRPLLSSPGGREWWEQNRQLYEPDFQNYLESTLGES